MQVILLENVENVGKQYEVKEVADGYARNFLLPKKLAQIATEEKIEWACDMIALQEEKAAQELEKVGETASRLDGFELEIIVKTGKKGELYEKIDEKHIATELKKQGFKVDKKQVFLKEKIEQIGDYKATIKFEHGLEVEIKVAVSTQSQEEEGE